MNRYYLLIKVFITILCSFGFLSSPHIAYGQDKPLLGETALYYSSQSKKSSSFTGKLTITKKDAFECGSGTFTAGGPITVTLDKPLTYGCGDPMSETWSGTIAVDGVKAPGAGLSAPASVTGKFTYYFSKPCGAAPCGISNPCCTNTPITGNEKRIEISAEYPKSWNVGTEKNPKYHGWATDTKTEIAKLTVYSIKVEIKRPETCISKQDSATFTAVTFPAKGGKLLWSTGDTTPSIKILVDKAQALSVTFTIDGVSYKESIKVCALTSETVAESPAKRDRLDIGVGEEVKLTYEAGATATWTATGTGTLSKASGKTITYTAGENKEEAVITAAGDDGTCCIKFNVLRPTSLTMARKTGTNLQHTEDRPDCGFQADLFVHPDNVNFYRVEIREKDSKAVAKNSYAGFNGVYHGNFAAPDRVSGWLPLTIHADASGSSSASWDNIYSGDPGVAATGDKPPFKVGTMNFPITWQWHVVGKKTAVIDFPSMNQDHEITAPGKCKSTKAGHSETTTYTDKTSTP